MNYKWIEDENITYLVCAGDDYSMIAIAKDENGFYYVKAFDGKEFKIELETGHIKVAMPRAVNHYWKFKKEQIDNLERLMDDLLIIENEMIIDYMKNS